MKTLNIINVSINFKEGTCEKTGISVVQGDYNSTKVVFEFDESANDKIKMFEMKNPSDELVYADEIVNNEVILVGTEEVEGQEQIVSLFNEEGDYTFEVSLYGNDSKLTSVCDYITARKEEVVIEDETTGQYLTLFDNLMNTLDGKIDRADVAITQANNLNLDVSKEGKIATVTLTKKDGTPKEVEILDGDNGIDGKDGKDATINGVNTLTIVEGTNIEVLQEGSTMTINNTYSYDDSSILADISNLQTNKADKSEIPTKTSDLINNSDYTTKTYVDGLVGDIETILTTLDVGSGVNGN